MKLSRLLYFLVVIGIGLLVVANLGQFKSFAATIRQADLFILATIVLARYLYYWSNAKYFQSAFRILDGGVPFKKAFEASVIYNFFNVVLPSGGVSGASYIAKKFDKDVGASVATAVQVAYYIFTFIGYFIVLFLGLISLFLSNQLGRVSYRVILLVVMLIIIGGIAITALVANYRLAKRVIWKIFTPINWVLKLLHKEPFTHKQVNHFLQEFYDSFRELVKARSKLVAPLWYCFLGVFSEVLSIFIVFLALGHLVNPGIVVAAYSLAMISSFAAFFTGGIGVYEAVMIGTFVALGMSFSLSFTVVLLYRFIAMWLFVPVGFIMYRKAERSD